MRVVSCCSVAGYAQYGHRWDDGKSYWHNAEFKMEGDWISGRLQEFKAKYKDYVAPDWRYDIVKFSHKVFAAYEHFYDYDGIGVWLDADCVTYRDIPEGYIESLLGDGYMALLKRRGYHTETGFWIVDCRHAQHKAFFDRWLSWFETGAFKQLDQWHDCTTLDATVRHFAKEGVKFTNLSGEHERDMHPLSKIELGKYIDHCKGARKEKGFSPENKWASDRMAKCAP
jgi:hypothetical protein